jgi:DNA-binding MarR family transcriptional regulator
MGAREERAGGTAVHDDTVHGVDISHRDIYSGVPTSGSHPVAPSVYRDLARFRYGLRIFLRFSERAARGCGITPLQHQLLLGIAGFTGRGWATVSDLSEYLQQRHNAVVALVQRAQRAGLVSKRRDPGDRRVMRVRLTPRGRRIIARLSRLHHGELSRLRRDLASAAAPRRGPPAHPPNAKAAAR